MKNILFIFVLLIISGCTFYHEKTDVRPALWSVTAKYQDDTGNNYLNLKSNDGLIFEKLSIPEKCNNVINVGSIVVVEQIVHQINGIKSVHLNVNDIEKHSCFGYLR
jgi:hypothetical protein